MFLQYWNYDTPTSFICSHRCSMGIRNEDNRMDIYDDEYDDEFDNFNPAFS